VKPSRERGGCWPTAEQELLLQAALLEGQPVIDAWQQWTSRVDIDDVDPGSYRLLPLVYRNLLGQGVTDPLLDKLKGVYRKTWFENQLLFHRMARVLQALHGEGIETLVLKGAALVPLYYRDYGLRPMQDFDLLVHPGDLARTIALLREMGWHRSESEALPLDLVVPFRHALSFWKGAADQFDLHWYALRGRCWAEADDEFWAGAVAFQLGKVDTLALNPTDELLHTCVHGLAWNPVPPFRWAADAMMVLNTSGPEIDWSRLVAQARQRRLSLPLTAALDYLARTLHAPAPPEALADLRSRVVSRFERIEYETVTRHDGGIVASLSRLLVSYERYAPHESLWHRATYFPRYLQFNLEAPHLWQLPRQALRRMRSTLMRFEKTAE